MGLKEYQKKRDFDKTPEPAGPKKAAKTGQSPGSKKEGPTFVVQKHEASHLHYDFRLEMDGLLKSWAVPKGPSLDPGQKRLAVRTEDHPPAYGGFEGTIPEGQYGGGTVMVWDCGSVEYEAGQGEMAEAVESRRPFAFTLQGHKLSGRWRLVPFATRDKKKRNWLLIKSRDESADSETDVLKARPDSAKSGRSLEEIAAANQQWSAEEAGYGD